MQSFLDLRPSILAWLVGVRTWRSLVSPNAIVTGFACICLPKGVWPPVYACWRWFAEGPYWSGLASYIWPPAFGLPYLKSGVDLAHGSYSIAFDGMLQRFTAANILRRGLAGVDNNWCRPKIGKTNVTFMSQSAVPYTTVKMSIKGSNAVIEATDESYKFSMLVSK